MWRAIFSRNFGHWTEKKGKVVLQNVSELHNFIRVESMGGTFLHHIIQTDSVQQQVPHIL